MCRRGRSALVYPTPLAKFAIRTSARADVSVPPQFDGHHVALCLRGEAVTIERLDRFNAPRGEWREVLIEDHTAGLAETATARADGAACLAELLVATAARNACTSSNGVDWGRCSYRRIACECMTHRARLKNAAFAADSNVVRPVSYGPLGIQPLLTKEM